MPRSPSDAAVLVWSTDKTWTVVLPVALDDGRPRRPLELVVGGRQLPGVIGSPTAQLGRKLVMARSPAQHHGGPSSTNSQHTSVGTTAIRRFLRPVTWQGPLQEVLPQELTDGYRGIPRRVDGTLELSGEPLS